MGLIATLFNHTFTVTRKTRASDGQGGWTQTYGSVGSVSGRMRPASATEKVAAAQRQAEISHVLYTAADENIVRGDRVAGEGRTWDVTAIREPSHAGHHLEIEAVEIQIEGQP
ncbi:MAG TPA: phage head closure protein [Anaerolineae bacterium]|nr:phage head closure protein [Anaerolineae bacterium]